MPDHKNMQPVRQITVDSDSAQRRLDNFLLSQLKGLPRPRVYRMIRSGEVRVNKRRAKPGYRLVPGDVVRVPPIALFDKGSRARPRPADSRWITERVIYDDDDLLVLDKPAGLAVHGGSGISFGAIELLRAAMPHSSCLELAHRLDRDTSGCLLVAKRRSSLRKLHQMFREGEVGKTYIALLAGHWNGGPRTVDSPLYTEHRKGGERHVRVDKDGKSAMTRIEPQVRFDQATLVNAQLLTGRTHQIRVHTESIGHPVLGDRRYGSEDYSLEKKLGLERLFLHATVLKFQSPSREMEITVESPLEDELQAALARLEGEKEKSAKQNP
jgi:23S rRNA pseudouridine955/2504/2580 synthase